MREKLFKSRNIPVYTKNGKSNIEFSRGKAGVYMIYAPNGILRYIGYSGSQLEKTILRHFQSWEDNKQVRVSYANKSLYSVRIVLTTPTRAAALERALIVKYKPVDNPNKLSLYMPAKEEIQLLDEFENSFVKTNLEMEDAPF